MKINENVLRVVLTVVAALVAIALCVVVVFTVGDIICDIREMKDQASAITTQTRYLRSVNYVSNFEGGFFLGVGRIQGEEYYVCYEELEDGGIILLKLEADCTVVYETLNEGEKAYVEVDKTGLGLTKSIRLYVPQNTVRVDYDISLDGK